MGRQYFAECECTLTTCMLGSRARKRCSNSEGKQLARDRRKASKKEQRAQRRAAKADKSKGERPKKKKQRERKCFRGLLCPDLRAAVAVAAGRAAVTLAAKGEADAIGTEPGPEIGAGADRPAAIVQKHPPPFRQRRQGTVGARSRRQLCMEGQGLL